MPLTKLILFFFIGSIPSFCQDSLETRAFINEKILIANDILYDHNQNVENLKVFQQELQVWAADKNKSSRIPTLKSNVHNDYDIYYRTRKDHGLLLNNYEYQLFKLNKYYKEFNEVYNELKALPFTNNLQYNIELAYYLRKLDKKAEYIAEVTNDYANARIVNFKNEKYPAALLNVKEVISNSKGLILAMRFGKKDLVIEFKKMLDGSLMRANRISTAASTKKENQINLSSETVQSMLKNIYSKARDISTWGEEYIRIDIENEKNEKEIYQLIQLSIDEFNKTAELYGCANSFNKLLKNMPIKYMFFTEEPSTIFIESLKIPKSKKAIAIDNTKENKIVEDVNTLADAKPNNLILLMDVSISMKKSGKFPLLIQSIKHAVDIMRPKDKITLIAYSGQAKVLIAAATDQDKTKIDEILNTLQSSGGSDLGNALKEGYKIAADNYISNGNTQLIIASDGVFGVTSTISNLVIENASKDFGLSVFHYGSKKDGVSTKTLKNLANAGNGQYELIETETEAINALMRQIKKEQEDNLRFD